MKPFQYHRHYSHEHSGFPTGDSTLIRRLWKYLSPYRAWIFLAVCFLICSKSIEAYIPIAMGNLTQHILTAFTSTQENKELLLTLIVEVCGMLLALLLLGYGLDAVTLFIKSSFSQRSILSLRSAVYQHILHLPLSYYDRNAVGRLMTRTIHDVDQINQMFAESIVPLLGNMFLFFGIVTGIFTIDRQIGIVFICLLPVVWWLTHRFRSAQRRCYEKIRAIVSVMNGFIQEHLMGASTIRTFGLEEKESRTFQDINEDYSTAYLETTHHFAFFFASIDFLQSVSLILVFVVLMSFSPVGSVFQAGTFFTFSLYALMFFRPLADLAERYNVLQAAMAAAGRVFHVLDQPLEPKNQGILSLASVESIEFKDVWFAYKDENWVLKGLSLTLRKGESVALVGMTGAGKTSVMSLLLRFYPFQKGTITINGIDIHAYSLHSLRRHFSIVLQDPVIFSGSMNANITLFQSAISHEKVEQVVDFLGMRGLINRFSDGLSHHLTERGKSLSMGEMQLISMARALVADRDFLLLDEATANIDSGTEKIIQDALGKILKSRTSLVIAHRLSTIENAHRIVVLHQGVVAETGTHEQLLASKGIYEKLYRLQFE